MKTIILLAVITVVVTAVPAEENIDYYVTGNDHLDIEALIANTKEFQSYIDCFKDLKPCTDIPTSFKVHIPEAVVQACKRCNPRHKHIVRRFLETLKQNLPEEYDYFRKAYDPENKYFDALEKAVSEY